MIIADADGFTNWDEVNIAVRTGHINSCYPNPFTSTLNIDYSLDNVTSAYVLITSPFTTNVSSYILNPSSGVGSLNLQSLASGIYNVVLVCDGHVMDATTIQKQ